jgi:hydroxyacylglutathione hydrolase
LDVRTPSEFKEDHIEGAIHIEAGYIEQNIDKLDSNTTYAIMCGGGYRASLAASLLKKNGFDNVVNVLGGMSAWNDHKVEEKAEA